MQDEEQEHKQRWDHEERAFALMHACKRWTRITSARRVRERGQRVESANSEESTSGEKSASGVDSVNLSRGPHIERKSMVSARKSPCKLCVQAQGRVGTMASASSAVTAAVVASEAM